LQYLGSRKIFGKIIVIFILIIVLKFGSGSAELLSGQNIY